MATTKGQRIGIWVIAGMMFLGTVGGFVAMMVAPGNEAKDQAALKKAQDELARAQGKLANEKFTSKAPENVVNAEREKAQKAQALIENLQESLKNL